MILFHHTVKKAISVCVSSLSMYSPSGEREPAVKTPSHAPSQATVRAWLHALATRTGLFHVPSDQPVATTGIGTRPWDHELEVVLAGEGRRIRLLVEATARAHPQRVIASLAPLANMAHVAGGTTLPLLAAPYISSRVAQVCRDHGVGYLDGGGNSHLAGPGLYVHVEGLPNRAPDTRPAEHLFAPRSSRVSRLLLEEPDRPWRVQDLARNAGISIGLASRIKRKLVQEAYAQDTPQGVRLADGERLLMDWAEAYRPPMQRAMVYGLDGPAEVQRRIVQWGRTGDTPCALAEFSAASRLAPMVRSTRVVLYVLAKESSEVLRRLLADLSLREVDSGPTAELWLTNDESVFRGVRDVEEVPVVSPIQTYLDVRRNPARGAEAAEEIYRTLIQPTLRRPGGNE